MKSLLPKGHKEPPTIRNYMKFKEGENRFRILSEAIVGYEYFNTEKKPVRSRKPFADYPTDIKQGGKVNYFWAFIVYNHNDAEIALEAGLPSDSAIQILEIPQRGIRESILAFSGNKKWGDYDTYDIVVNRVGTGFDDTEYSVIAEPHSKLELDERQKAKVASINLEALYDGTDPFSKDSTGVKKADFPVEGINPEEIPF